MNRLARMTTSQRRRVHPALGWRRAFRIAALGALLWAAVSPSVGALQKDIRSKARNFPNAQVVVKRSEVKLVEVFSTPTQIVFPGAGGMKTKPSMIQYANRAGKLPSTYPRYDDEQSFIAMSSFPDLTAIDY